MKLKKKKKHFLALQSESVHYNGKSCNRPVKSLCRLLKRNISRIQIYNAIMYGYFCIGFINLTFEGKTLTYYINFFSPSNLKEMMI